MTDAALLLRDFVNTVDLEREVDEFATPAGLTGWLAERGLLADAAPQGTSADPRPATAEAVADADDLAVAIALRKGLRAAMLAHHGGDAPALPPELPGSLARLPLHVSLTGSRPALVPALDGVAAGLGRIAAAIVDSAAEGTWQRLKACQEDTCRWAFLDTSKNRSRAWCSMRVCGNRTKTRAYRARRRSDPAGDL
ncbi:CGNR zinc finger domain-containing protein [Actinomadura alba]|uniref:CGNR zinc finger domain-containing protein n=1 Tax=Actinomadura alba TaxID=406431 RepID=A0ABR7LGU0_9ACTN|nr:CGNR zinc finger domain-containing protein [Actinomadura alba]MBC6464071.1 CGNR zinc finger domain-containing protein [Actinomadura alba]